MYLESAYFRLCYYCQVRQKKIVCTLTLKRYFNFIWHFVYSLVGVPEQFDPKSINSEVFHKWLLRQEAWRDVTLEADILTNVVAHFIQFIICRWMQTEATQTEKGITFLVRWGIFFVEHLHWSLSISSCLYSNVTKCSILTSKCLATRTALWCSAGLQAFWYCIRPIQNVATHPPGTTVHSSWVTLVCLHCWQCCCLGKKSEVSVWWLCLPLIQD